MMRGIRLANRVPSAELYQGVGMEELVSKMLL